MAINIFSGSGSGKSRGANSAKRSERAKAAAAAVAGPAAVSDSGNTAVGTKGTLGKVGSTVGKLANVASKFLPGVGGVVAKGIASIFNDNEWWQEVPGDAITLNEPLRFVSQDSSTSAPQGFRSAILEFLPTITALPTNTPSVAAGNLATRMLIWQYAGPVLPNRTVLGDVNVRDLQRLRVMNVSRDGVTQYLLPQVRRVVNAIPLQTAEAYAEILEANATVYAIWRNLKKFLYMVQHGTTYLASLDDIAFPVLRTSNAAWLQSTINRLEEFLRSGVRLPHTMCEYLAWRYGRTYRSNSSAKAALVQYNVLPLSTPPEIWDALISRLTGLSSTTASLQQANTDMYNTYIDHDYMVEIRDDTQFKYDLKEFMLRMNLVGCYYYQTEGSEERTLTTMRPNRLVVIDSELSNPETFMASTVSMPGRSASGEFDNLFPVDVVANVYIPKSEEMQKTSGSTSGGPMSADKWLESGIINSQLQQTANPTEGNMLLLSVAPPQINQDVIGDQTIPAAPGTFSTTWCSGHIYLDIDFQGNAVASGLRVHGLHIANALLSKAVDLYNMGIYDRCTVNGANKSPSGVFSWATSGQQTVDFSDIAMDAGSPTQTVLATEHVYAFANLVDIRRKHSMSYKQAEQVAATEVANLVDKLDVASAASPTTKS